jgi:uncharacterized protein YjbI with pentapeptide repeats
MVNEEHLAILQQGVHVWNQWREEHPDIRPDLSKADLRWTILPAYNLATANLRNANLHGANLRTSDLSGANLTKAELYGADFTTAKLVGANLSKAKLSEAIFLKADVSEANLSGAYLIQANLTGAKLAKTNWHEVTCLTTVFADVDLSDCQNLESVKHLGASTMGIDTLYKSGGNIPTVFLEGCGVSEVMITFAKSLVGKAIEYYSCFISYSTRNDDFARQLNDRMKHSGLRVWFAPEEMKGGKKIHEQLYEAIRYHDKLILVLSEASMNSTWVQTEIKRARKHERDEKRRKLFPISLVPFGEIQKWELFDGDEGRDLAQEIREYYIPDFSHWKDYDKFTLEFEKLLRALRADE